MEKINGVTLGRTSGYGIIQMNTQNWPRAIWHSLTINLAIHKAFGFLMSKYYKAACVELLGCLSI